VKLRRNAQALRAPRVEGNRARSLSVGTGSPLSRRGAGVERGFRRFAKRDGSRASWRAVAWTLSRASARCAGLRSEGASPEKSGPLKRTTPARSTARGRGGVRRMISKPRCVVTNDNVRAASDFFQGRLGAKENVKSVGSLDDPRRFTILHQSASGRSLRGPGLNSSPMHPKIEINGAACPPHPMIPARHDTLVPDSPCDTQRSASPAAIVRESC
jgi:hypothetical protein